MGVLSNIVAKKKNQIFTRVIEMSDWPGWQVVKISEQVQLNMTYVYYYPVYAMKWINETE